MKSKIIILLVFTSLFLQSCNDTEFGYIEPTKKISTFQDYFDFFNSDAKGTILIQSNQTLYSNSPIYSATSSIAGNATPFPLNLNSTIINFSNPYFSTDKNRSYVNSDNQQFGLIYGSNYVASIDNGQVVLTTDNSDPNMYVPGLINIAFTGLDANGNIVEGTQINWNADAKNTNGTVIGFEYNPYLQTQQIVNQKSDRLLKGSTQIDNGTYTVTAADLIDFPSGSLLTIYIGRAGYHTLIDNATGSNQYSIGALTISTADLEITN